MFCAFSCCSLNFEFWTLLFFFCSVVVVVFVFINHPKCCLSICPPSVLPSICPSYYGWMLLVLILLPLVASSHKKVKNVSSSLYCLYVCLYIFLAELCLPECLLVVAYNFFVYRTSTQPKTTIMIIMIIVLIMILNLIII